MIEASNLFWTVALFAFVFGSLIGSFLNVVIYRVPEGLSIARPPSRCPSCETPIRWYDNVPIVSWLVLGGKCRNCKVEIPARYAMVEALTGFLAAGVWWRVAGKLLDMEAPIDPMVLSEIAPLFFVQFTLVAFLVAITFIDLDHFLIPHVISLPGIAVALASPWLLSAYYGNPNYLAFWPPVTPTASLAGAIAGFLAVVAIFYLYLAARGVEGIGGGDATLMALIGGWLGWPAIPFIFFAASAQGVLAAGVSVAFGGNFARDSREIFEEELEDELQDALEEEPPPDGDDDGSDPSAEQGDESDAEETAGDDDGPAKLAVPFGPFLSLAALEFYYFGPLLPPELAMTYFYY